MSLPVSSNATPYIRHVVCVVGAHLEPLGACIIGNDDHHDGVLERRDADSPNRRRDDGCTTKSATTTDANGASKTRTKTNC
jgi:hypothetical protein